jgi:hypothetical protein
MAEMSNVHKVLFRKSEGQIIFWRPSNIWKASCKTRCNTLDIKMRGGFIWFNIGTSSRLLRIENENLGSKNHGEFPDMLKISRSGLLIGAIEISGL